MKRKIDETNFFKIRNFARLHSIAETAREFGVCPASVSQCKRFNTVEEYRKHSAQVQRQNYLARKSKIKLGNGLHFEPPKKPIDGTGGKTVNGDPFGNAAKPRPVLPVEAQKAPAQDGPVVTYKLEESNKTFPLTYGQYRKAYAEQEIEIGTLKGKLAKANMDLKEWGNKYDVLETLYGNLRGAYKRKTERLEALELAQKPLEPLGNVVSIPKIIGVPTELEIKVGDAVIKVRTNGK